MNLFGRCQADTQRAKVSRFHILFFSIAHCSHYLIYPSQTHAQKKRGGFPTAQRFIEVNPAFHKSRYYTHSYEIVKDSIFFFGRMAWDIAQTVVNLGSKQSQTFQKANAR